MKKFLILLFIFFQHNLFAQIILPPKNGKQEAVNASYFKDTRDTLSIDSIQLFSNSYFSGRHADLSSLLTIDERDVYWLKFSLVNGSDFDRTWLINFDSWVKVDFYRSENGKIVSHQVTGTSLPVVERDYAYANHNFISVPLLGGEKRDYFVRLEGSSNAFEMPKNLSFSIFTPDEIKRQREIELYFLGGVLGMLVILFFYNLFIYLSVKDDSYLYYLVIIAVSAYSSQHNLRYTFEWFSFLKDYPKWFIYMDALSAPPIPCLYILLIKRFFDLPNRLPVWDKICNAIIVVLMCSMLLLFFINPYVVYRIEAYLFIASNVFLYALCWACYVRGYYSAGFIVVALSFIFVGVLVFCLAIAGVLPSGFLVSNAFIIAHVMEVTVVSFAFANRINVLKNENIHKQQEIIEQLRKNQEFNDLNNQLKLDAEGLKQEVMAAKYETLKNQVNPHFLFNNLNVLAELVATQRPEAHDFLMGMSKVYRYVLSIKEMEVVTLAEEINFAVSYLSLLKIRFGNALTYELSQVSDNEFVLIPLSLQGLLENAVKHNLVEENNPLNIVIKTERDYLVVENNKITKQTNPYEVSGTGLDTIKKRYKYLTDRPVLVEQDMNSFKVSLPLLYLIEE